MIGIVIAMRFMSKKSELAFVSLVWGQTTAYQSSCHGLSTTMSAWAKSRTLRVTSLQSHACAVVAMIESRVVMDLPCASACAVICAQACDAFWSNAKIRSSKPALRSWPCGSGCSCNVGIQSRIDIGYTTH